MASPRQFRPSGQCGTAFSDFLPHTASCADDICLVRSVQTDAFNHDPAELLVMTGSTELGRPALGSWVSYGLGSESQDLPALLVLSSGVGPSAGSNIWSNGFLPSVYQGTRLASTGDPISYLSSPAGVSRELQRARLDAVRLMNEKRYRDTGDTEIAARIADIDQLLTRQLNEIMHAEDFQKLEGSWRGLNYLVMQSETSTTLKSAH